MLTLGLIAWLLVPVATHQSANTVGVGSGPAQDSSSSPNNSRTQTAAVNNSSGPLATATGSSTNSAKSGGASATSNGGTGTALGGGSTVSGSEQAGGGCVSPPGSDQGVTSKQIQVAITLINLAGGVSNSAVNYPSVQQQQQYFQQVIGTVNSSGGVACRQLTPQFYSPNIVDESAVQQACLQIVQSKPFAVLDVGVFGHFPALATCLSQAGIPLLTEIAFPQKAMLQNYPYLFSFNSQDVTYHNTAFALKQLGFFSASSGFSKLGISYQDCEPEFLPEFEGWLNQAGVSSSQIVTFDVGCPAAQTPPNIVEQEVLTFQSKHVTNVTFLSDQGTFYTFTEVAQQQGYHPKYGIPDDTEVDLSDGGGGTFNFQNLNGAIAITGNSWGEQHTAGITPSGGTQKCDTIFAKHGEPPVLQQQAGAGGGACDLVWMFAAAAQNAPLLQRSALAAGLQRARSVDFSYPGGPNNFSGSRVTWGGEFWRPVEAYASCTCWRVLNPTFQPSFS